MRLSSDLISQFVKVTNDNKDTKNETVVYGTVKKISNTLYVQPDWSDQLIPISKYEVNDDGKIETITYINSSAADLKEAREGDRVTIMIKNHVVTLTGNLSSPAASTDDSRLKIGEEVYERVSEIEVDNVKINERIDANEANVNKVVADNVSIKEQLTAAEGKIGDLETENVSVKERLDAAEGDIKILKSDTVTTKELEANYATIESLKATNADVYNLNATFAEFKDATAEKLTVHDAVIDNLDATYAKISRMEVAEGKIDDLEAKTADIDTLEADVAKIDNLIFDGATGNTMHANFANAVIALLGNAWVKSAMIDSVAANKITGDIVITEDLEVISEDGHIVIQNGVIQVLDDDKNVRVQLGKDASNNYSITIWDVDGNKMFDAGGITADAIKSDIIVDNMVSATADIDASKLNIESLFNVINDDGTNTIKATKVKLDEEGQTLEVAFNTLNGEVDAQGTQITAIQGQISSKVWQQDIDRTINNLDIGGRNLFILNNSEEGFLLTNGSTLGEMHSIRNERTSEYIVVQEGATYIFQVWCTIDMADTEDPNLWMAYDLYDAEKVLLTNRPAKRTHANVLANGQCYDLYRITIPAGAKYIRISARFYSDGLIKFEEGNIPTEWTPAPEDIESGIATLSTKYSSIEQTVDSISTVVSEHDTKIETKADAGTVTEVSNKVSALTQNLEGFKTTVSNTYATKTALSDTDAKASNAQNDVDNLTERVSTAETSIGHNAEAIALRATKTEVSTAKSEAISAASSDATNKANAALNSANENTANSLKQYSTTEQMNAAIQLSADGIHSSVRGTYATKASVDSIEVGGRNLYIVKNAVDGFLSSNGDGGINAPGGVTKEKTSDYIPVDVGDTVRFQVWVTTPDSSYVWYGYQFYKEDKTALDTNRPAIHLYDTAGMYYHATYDAIVVPEGAAYIRVSARLFEDGKIKVERGTKPTDWTPAPEDMATVESLDTTHELAEAANAGVIETQSLVQQLSNSISMLVTDGNGTSLMTQTEDGWTFSTSDIQTSINNVSEGLDSLVHDVGDIDNAVDILQQAVDDLGVTAEYIRIGTYEDEPCIELGESDSDFKLIITNTRILFMEGSSVPACINNQSLHITKAVIEEEIQQGEFVWKVRANGNMGLMWKGASSGSSLPRLDAPTINVYPEMGEFSVSHSSGEDLNFSMYVDGSLVLSNALSGTYSFSQIIPDPVGTTTYELTATVHKDGYETSPQSDPVTITYYDGTWVEGNGESTAEPDYYYDDVDGWYPYDPEFYSFYTWSGECPYCGTVLCGSVESIQSTEYCPHCGREIYLNDGTIEPGAD